MADLVLVVAVGVLVFVAAALGDFIEAYYTRAAAKLDAVRAPRMSVLMVLVSSIGALAFIEAGSFGARCAVLAVECAGVWYGSRLAIKRQQRRAAIKRQQRELRRAKADAVTRLRVVA